MKTKSLKMTDSRKMRINDLMKVLSMTLTGQDVDRWALGVRSAESADKYAEALKMLKRKLDSGIALFNARGRVTVRPGYLRIGRLEVASQKLKNAIYILKKERTY